MYENMNEILELWGSEYEIGRSLGKKHTPAKNAATNEIKRAYPFLTACFQKAQAYRAGEYQKDESVSFGMALSAKMGQLGLKLRKKWDADTNESATGTPPPPPPSLPPNGTYQRQKPGLILYESGYSNVAATIVSVIKSLGLRPGDVINLGDMAFWGEVMGCSDSAIPNIFQGSGGQKQLINEGYVFEILDKSYRKLTVKVVSAPRSDTDKKRISEIEFQLAKLASELAALKD